MCLARRLKAKHSLFTFPFDTRLNAGAFTTDRYGFFIGGGDGDGVDNGDHDDSGIDDNDGDNGGVIIVKRLANNINNNQYYLSLSFYRRFYHAACARVNSKIEVPSGRFCFAFRTYYVAIKFVCELLFS